MRRRNLPLTDFLTTLTVLHLSVAVRPSDTLIFGDLKKMKGKSNKECYFVTRSYGAHSRQRKQIVLMSRMGFEKHEIKAQIVLVKVTKEIADRIHWT